MSSFRHDVILGVFATVGLVSCTVDTALPSSVQVRCQSDADCPASFKCNETRQLCIPESVDDLEAPSVLGATIAPTVSSAGRTVSVVIEVDEALGALPQIFFVDDNVERYFEVATTLDQDVHVFEATYFVDGSESERSHQLRVVVEDELGNSVSGPLPVAIEFDFTSPSIVEGTLTRELIPNHSDLAYAINPLAGAELSAVTQGTEVSYLLLADELVHEVSYEVRQQGSELPLASLDLGVRELPAVALNLTLPGSSSLPSDGVYEIRIRMTDEAGNQSEPMILDDGLVVQTTPPAEPGQSEVAAIRFIRRPYGNGNSALPSFSILGEPGVVGPDTWVFVYGDSQGMTELSRFRSNADGSFGYPDGMNLPTGDRQTVFVGVVDNAGNRSDVDSEQAGSQPTRVTQVSWTANLRGKVGSSSFANPNRFSSRSFSTGSLREPRQNEELFWDEASGVASLEDDSTLVTTSSTRWASVIGSAEPFNIPLVSMTYDAVRGEVLLAGGYTGTFDSVSYQEKFYRRDRSRWVQIVPVDAEFDGNPPTAPHPRIAFDPATEEVVTDPDGDGKTWVWDGTRWLGLPKRPGDGIPAEGARGMAYNPKTHALTMVVGNPDSPVLVYRWDGVSWLPECEEEPCLSSRPEPYEGIASDAIGHSLPVSMAPNRAGVFFWGSSSGWVYDGQIWTRLCTDEPCSNSFPLGRTGASVSLDIKRDLLVLYGGQATEEANSFIDTWEWDGNAWSCNRPAFACAGEPNCPQGNMIEVCNVARSGAGYYLPPDDSHAFPSTEPLNGTGMTLVYDAKRSATLLVGQQTSQILWAFGSWEWDGQVWTPLAGQTTPTAAAGAATATYEPTQEVVAYGGLTSDFDRSTDSGIYRAGLWTYDCQNCPPSDYRGSLVYDPSSEAMVFVAAPMFSLGEVGIEVWTWRPDRSPRWVKVFGCESEPCATRPQSVDVPDTVYDPVIEGIWMLGAGDGALSGANELWLWKNNAWTRHCDGPPCSDQSPALGQDIEMTYAASLGGVLVTSLEETWLWDGTSWASLPGEPGRTQGRLVELADTGEILLIGGDNGAGDCQTRPAAPGNLCDFQDEYCGGLRVYTGTTWVDVPSQGLLPVGRRLPFVAPLAEGGLVMGPGLYRGTVPSGPFGCAVFDEDVLESSVDLWEGSGAHGPQHVFTAALGSALDGLEASVRGISVSAVTGALGHDATSLRAGASIVVWNGIRWSATDAANIADADSPAPLQWDSETDPQWNSIEEAVFQSLLVGRDRNVHIGLEPSAPYNAVSTPSVLATDYIEVTVRYSLH